MMATYTMYLAASCSYLVALGFGFTVGYSSPALPAMEKQNLVTSQVISTFSTLMMIGGMFGCPLGGWFMERFGRKWLLFVSCIPVAFGWIMISLAGPSSLLIFYFGRLLTGFGCGMSTVAFGVYVAETATKQYRGRLVSGVQLGITVGVLIVYILGMFCGWKSLAALGCVFPVCAGYLAMKVPETPRWYLLKGRKAEAVRALQQLRGTMAVEEELQDIEEALPNKGETLALADLAQPEVMRPLMIVIMLGSFQQLTGINVVTFFTVSIFESAGLKGSSIIATIAVGAVQVVATAAAVYMMDRAGRRPLLFLGGVMLVGSCFTMALYYRWAARTPIPHLTWMAVLSLIVYICGFSIGWGPVPPLVCSEVLPLKTRSATTAISAVCGWGTSCIITYIFMDFVAAYGQDTAFGLFGLLTVIGTLLVYLYVPETKGKTLEEIELYFLGHVLHGR